MGTRENFSVVGMRFRHKIIALSVAIQLFTLQAFSQDSASAPFEGFWLWNFLGRFHPAIVHFPIGLLYIALLFELLGRRKRSLQYAGSVRLTVLIAAGTAIVAVILGLMLSKNGDYSEDALQVHQWTGIATMVLSVFTAILYQKKLRH